MKTTRAAVFMFGSIAAFSFLLSQQVPAGPSANETLQSWFDLALQWGGTVQGSNSKYSEGDTIPLRFTASLPSGTTHTILLKYDFSSGGTQRFFDSLASYNASVQNADPTVGITGLSSPLQWPIPLDASLPALAQIPAGLRTLTTYNISALANVGSYSLTNGVKAIRLTFTVASGTGEKNVLIAFGGHLASETAWGVGNGASHFPGASTKVFTSLDGNSDKNVSVNPNAIVADVTPPVITCPGDIVRSTDPGRCSAIVTYTVTATDDTPGVTVVGNPASGSAFPKGTNTVLCTATDAAGNSASCSFRIIVRDTENPSIVCPLNLVKTTDAGQCSANVSFAATSTDNCEVASTIYKIGTTVITSPHVFPVGTTPVTCTATDATGNSSSCSFTVTVSDNEAPKPNCPGPIVVPSDAGQCSAGVSFAATPTDNCGVASTVYRIGTTVITSPRVFPIGTTTVDVTVTDVHNNTANCSFNVTVLDPPNITWPQAMPLTLVGNSGTQTADFNECIIASDQSRWFKFKVKPGSRLIVTLTGLPANYDLVLFKDIAKAFAELNSQQNLDLVHLSAEFADDAFSSAAFSADAFSPAAFSPAAFSPAAFSPAAFSPAAFSPAAFSPAAFSPAAFSPDAFAPAAFSPAAFSTDAFSPAAFSPAAFSPAAFSPAAFSAAQIQSVLAVSAFDGTAGEGIIANTWDEDGDFYVRVRGRNGVFSTAGSFHLQVFLITGNCNNVSSIPLNAQNQPLPPSTFAAPSANYKTIILTDLNRMPGASQAKTDLQSKLATFAARPEVNGVVVDVSTDPWISFFNTQADDPANIDCPFAKNLVAGAIQDIVDRSRAGNAFEYVVIIGSDAVIPFFRYPDEALLGPEKHYYPPLRDFTTSQASLRLNYVLGQDQYGAGCTVSSKYTTIPVPGLAVGRLVETPSDALAMLDAYLSASGGVVPTPTSALVTGYDFLEDVANAVRTNLVTGLGPGGTTDALILNHTNSPTSPLAWTADDLRAQLLGKRHDLIFLAGHFSAIAALAADYSTHMLSTELAASTVNLKNAILFSPGCHSGYNTVDADGIPFVTLQPDWAAACASKQITLLAGTGYQYGDTDFIEYSERIYLEFVRQLRVGTGAIPIGKALARAKEIYLATTPQMRGIHQKAFLEATLFGLPMLSVNLPASGRLPSDADQSIVPSTQPFTTNPGLTLGLTFANVALTSSLTPHQVALTNLDEASTALATYLSGRDGIINNPAEPILPLEVRNVSVSGTVLRGVGFRGGAYTNVANILPLTGAPTTEIRGVHAAFLSDFFYPITPWLVNYFDALCNGVNGPTRLLVLPAQFLSDSPSSAKGTLREYQSMDFRLFYSANTTTYTTAGSNVPSTPALSSPPSISGVSGITVGANVLLSTHVTGNPAAGIQQVWVTYTAQSGPFARRWQSLDLIQNAADSTLWEGSLPLNGTFPEDVRYMVQAVNGVGAVALDAKLGAYHVPDESDGTGAPTSLALLTPPTTGAYGTVVTFKARLTSNGSPLATRKLRFSLGDQELQGVTDANGTATVKLNLLTVPGSYDLMVMFGGATGFAPTFITSPFTITKQSTALSLSPLTTYARPNVDTRIVATLVDGANTPILESTVFFVVTGTGGANAVANITDFVGRAPLGAVRLTNGSPLPDGSYTVTVYFGGTVPLPFPPPYSSVNLSDERYQPSLAAATLIIDSQGPVMTKPTPSPSVLQTPNHKMVSVTVSVSAIDNNNGPVPCKIVSVTSNEPINGTGDGDQEPDWNITGDLTVDLRAERAQNGPGRIYTITVECKDLAGNVTTGTATVSAPK